MHDRDIFIALIDAGLDESAVMAFIDGDQDHHDALAVVEALARDADLAEMVWAMRADRQALGGSLIDASDRAPDEAMIARALDTAFPAELDASTLSEIEETGFTEKPIVDPIYRPAKRRTVRRTRTKAAPTRWAVPLAAAATLVVGTLAVWQLSNLSTRSSHTPTKTPAPETLASEPGNAPLPANETNLADSSVDDSPVVQPGPIDESPQAGPRIITSPAEALELARQGRLVIRLTSASSATTRTLVEDLTMTAALSRFASLDGALDPAQSTTIAQALPDAVDPILASKDHPASSGPSISRQRVGVYMLRVEPTERAFMLLFAKLRTYDRTIVEVIATGEPVTTPGSAADLSRLRRSPDKWAPTISMPVVVEKIE